MALTTLSNIKTELEITSTDYDDILSQLIDNVSQTIATITDRVLEASYLDEYYDGNGSRELLLNEYPINSITSIIVSDTALTSNDYEYYSESGLVILDNAVSEGYRKIRVQYNAGYTSIPDDLEFLARRLVIEAFKAKDNPGIKSERVGNWSVTFSKSLLFDNPMYSNILDKYKRVVL